MGVSLAPFTGPNQQAQIRHHEANGTEWGIIQGREKTQRTKRSVEIPNPIDSFLRPICIYGSTVVASTGARRQQVMTKDTMEEWHTVHCEESLPRIFEDQAHSPLSLIGMACAPVDERTHPTDHLLLMTRSCEVRQ